jgi:serine/threonine-protein kinase
VTTVSTQPTAIGANDQDLAPGTEVGEYRIEGLLGKGGFGTVYAAVQPVIGKQVAIKVLARRYSADETVVRRFVDEARAVNQIRHRHIIDIFSFGTLADGRHYYVMEYMDGETLDQYLRANGPMPLDKAVVVLRAIARALDAAHAKGIAHRDIKPENIFLAHDADGSVFPKLLDFGIAKLLVSDDDVRVRTNTGVPLGTPLYMSPEQCRGRNVDHRTDIYSFGIVAYRVLTGVLPFDGDDYMELLNKQTHEEPIPPSKRNPMLSPMIDAAIAWMMRKDPAERPRTVIEGLDALAPDRAVTPSIPPPIARSHKPTLPPVKSITPDALAATFTPEFERPVVTLGTTLDKTIEQKPAVAAPRERNVVRWAIAISIVLLATAVAVVIVLRTGREPAPARVERTERVDPPLPTPQTVTPVVPTVEAVTPPVEPTPTPAPTGKRKIPTPTPKQAAPVVEQGSGSAEMPRDPKAPIDLGSDVFRKP